MPKEFGNWNSVYRAHYRWATKGIWEGWFKKASSKQSRGAPFAMIDATHIKAHQDACRYPGSPETQGLGKTKGGRNSKLNCVVNRDGKPVSFVLMPGNRHETITAKECLEGFAKAIVLADKGYDSDDFRSFVEAAGGVAMIPPQKESGSSNFLRQGTRQRAKKG